ncbi:hypothetical protein SETIT_4G143300v2 [Setaria italica]|uniref:Uncharacterized protein n=2 Tax=Setaria TaxID=4554 RepID=A0A368QUJ8_SETIT|nr:hypothetical protein SETIT_4G143300v2 [Setaria italica]RCV21485.1 hypothetical protein SETIT_4G143300v2 [Setaria italica]RCV21486.1 hypothetical protein SETIT_4G143300v2 [Setaria italica]TKW21278.1 hypothetical protein SEVIR_4G169700v2 [Setaria viridis]TKW21279.1 hypothetical protein SEVIR_4G169700v2 [Setaria viridis]
MWAGWLALPVVNSFRDMEPKMVSATHWRSMRMSCYLIKPWQTSALNWIIKSLDVFRLKVDAWLAYHTQGTYRDVIGILLKLKRLTNRHPSCYSSACWMATGNWDSGAGRHAELYIRV